MELSPAHNQKNRKVELDMKHVHWLVPTQGGLVCLQIVAW